MDYFDIDSNQRLWKYLDLAKLLNMINHNKLYLRRLDSFEDNFEGKAPLYALKYLPLENRVEAEKIYEARRKLRFINCWTRFDGKECYAMWKVYSNSYGLALETDVKCLSSLLPSNAIISKVKYCDFRNKCEECIIDLPVLWDKSLGEEESVLARNFSIIKSIEYEYEKEVRIIIPLKSNEEHISISMDMRKLVKRVVVSPYEETWFYDLVKDVINNKYGFKDLEVIKSDIDVSL